MVSLGARCTPESGDLTTLLSGVCDDRVYINKHNKIGAVFFMMVIRADEDSNLSSSVLLACYRYTNVFPSSMLL